MRWEKRGLIFSSTGQCGWMNSHAQVPTALLLDDRLRIFFAARPEQGLSLPTYVDLDRNDPQRVIDISGARVLDVGRPGTFDADGVMPSAVVRMGPVTRLYYSGWSRLGGRAPYNNATGLALSTDGGTNFARAFEGPILDRTAEEPWSATSPAVVRNDRRWHMWYSSGTNWIEVGGKLEHVYVLKGATSDDGVHWLRDNRQILPALRDDESQTRPTVIFLDGKWHMWFCFRGSRDFRADGDTYRIGYATSNDLVTWERNDAAAGIDLSETGWDSQMQCYPDVIEVDGRVLLFYNGNAFGSTGFGYAELT
jgi:hypothetical protein